MLIFKLFLHVLLEKLSFYNLGLLASLDVSGIVRVMQ
jgi:hypothetical protein